MKTALIAALALTAAVPAGATQILFSNFDDIALSGPSYIIIPTADGWTSTTNGIEIQGHNIAGNAYSQSNLVELDTTVNSSMFVTLGTGHYKVSYFYSPRPNQPSSTNGISLDIGSTNLDSVTGTGAADTVWQQRTVDFTTKGGALTFSAFGNSDGVGGYLDSISISTVPEPAMWGLMLGGFAMVGFAARNGRRTVAA